MDDPKLSSGGVILIYNIYSLSEKKILGGGDINWCSISLTEELEEQPTERMACARKYLQLI
jgi:hypothetical protein